MPIHEGGVENTHVKFGISLLTWMLPNAAPTTGSRQEKELLIIVIAVHDHEAALVFTTTSRMELYS